MPNTSSWRASQRVKEPPRSIQCYSNKFHAPNSPYPVFRHELHPQQPPQNSFCAKNPRWSPWFPPRARKISPRGVRLYRKKSGARLAASWGWSKTRAENVGGGDVFSFFSLVCYLFSPSLLLLSFSFSFSFFLFFFSSWVTIDLVTPRENHRADGISSGSQQGCDRGGKLKSTRKKGPIIAFNQHHCWSS